MLHIRIHRLESWLSFGMFKQSLAHTHNRLRTVWCTVEPPQELLAWRLDGLEEVDQALVVAGF